MSWTTLVSALELASALGQPNLAIVDCRFVLAGADPEAGEQAWRESHLPGAGYAHLDRDLTDHRKPAIAGRHPVPDDLDARLVVLGIDHPCSKETGNAAEAFACGLKGRYREGDGLYKDPKALDQIYTTQVSENDKLTTLEIPLRRAMNALLLDAYHAARERWLTGPRAGVLFPVGTYALARLAPIATAPPPRRRSPGARAGSARSSVHADR